MAWPNPVPADARNCMLYGSVTRPSGAGVLDVPVYIETPELRAEHGRTLKTAEFIGEGLLQYPVEVRTDATGYWEVELRRGMRVRVRIPRLKVDVENELPEDVRQDFTYWAYQPRIEDSRQFVADPVNEPLVMDTELVITVDSAFSPLVMRMFDQMAVFECATRNGVYVEETGVGTRIELIDRQVFYNFFMPAKPIGRWYKARFFDSTTDEWGPYSAPMKAVAPDYAQIITVAELKTNWLWGIDLTDDKGVPYPRDLFEGYIREAVNYVEMALDTSFVPTARVEQQDHYVQDYAEFEFIQLDRFPVLGVDSLIHQIGPNQQIFSVPTNWITVDNETGQLRVVPVQGSLEEVFITGSGRYIGPAIMMNMRWPAYLRIQYRYGFALGQIPELAKGIIARLACFGPLNIAGDLLLGAGIASISMGLDGVHQSISSTSSATNAGYGARLIRYDKEVKAMLPVLRRYFDGLRMTVI